MISGIIRKMQFMTPFKQGDVILIPFPFTDFSTLKQRPAVIISTNNFNRRGDDVVVVAVSSHLLGKGMYEYRLSEVERKAAGLPLPSSIKLGKVVTIDQRLARKHVGKLSSETMKKILSEFVKVIGEK